MYKEKKTKTSHCWARGYHITLSHSLGVRVADQRNRESEIPLNFSFSPRGRLAPSPHAARPPEQGDVPAVPSPGLLPLRPALPHLRRGGLLCHHLGHLLGGDETHLLCPRRRDHPAARPARKLQCEFCKITLSSTSVLPENGNAEGVALTQLLRELNKKKLDYSVFYGFFHHVLIENIKPIRENFAS